MAKKATKSRKHDASTLAGMTAHMRSMLDEHEERRQRKHDWEAHDHDCLECLKKALQQAIDLEFFTIPPYLCALWSIKDDVHPIAASIREVVQEEMLHMALACNLLAAVGGVPSIAGRTVYPNVLPGGVHEGLEVRLSGLSLESLEAFLHIELPQEPIALSSSEGWTRLPPEHCGAGTIGEFYATILEMFQRLDPPFQRERQVTGPLSYSNVGSLDSVEWVIDLISRQGEGATTPFEDMQQKDLAHYYRFLEIYVESELRWSKSAKKFLKGEDRPLPGPDDIRPMAPILNPEGYVDADLGGLDAKTRKLVRTNLDEFDRIYTLLLDQLEGAWTRRGGQESLIRAYETMFKLEDYAKPLMEVEIPGKPGQTFGPCFRYRKTLV